jgi:hypothetical protein
MVNGYVTVDFHGCLFLPQLAALCLGLASLRSLARYQQLARGLSIQPFNTAADVSLLYVQFTQSRLHTANRRLDFHLQSIKLREQKCYDEISCCHMLLPGSY